MKNKLIIGGLLAIAAATPVCAQEMVAGWDFSQFTQDGFTDTDGALPFETEFAANYTGTSADVAGGAAVGNFVISTSTGVEPQGFGDLTAGNQGFMGTPGNLINLGLQGQFNQNAKGLGFGTDYNGSSFDIEIDLGADLGSAWSLAFGGINISDPNNASAIAWSYSTGGGFVSTGITSNITNGEAPFSVDLTGVGALDGLSEVTFRGTLSGIDGGLTFIDNVGVSATVVPEPGSFATIAGLFAAGFVFLRRRK